jgi:hypothetical protein
MSTPKTNQQNSNGNNDNNNNNNSNDDDVDDDDDDNNQQQYQGLARTSFCDLYTLPALLTLAATPESSALTPPSTATELIELDIPSRASPCENPSSRGSTLQVRLGLKEDPTSTDSLNPASVLSL